ncbi:MAG: TlpA family protein disulfide reductase [Mycoplasmatales bacterium]
MKRLLTISLLTLIVVAGCSKEVKLPDQGGICDDSSDFCSVTDIYKNGYSIGNIFPDRTITTLDGKDVQLYDLISGHDKVIITLEASWCSDCHRQNQKLIDNYKDIPDNVLIIPMFTNYSSKVHEDKVADIDTTKEYVKELGLDQIGIPIYFDYDDFFLNKFLAAGTPTNIVLDDKAMIKAITLEYDIDILLQENKETL